MHPKGRRLSRAMETNATELERTMWRVCDMLQLARKWGGNGRGERVVGECSGAMDWEPANIFRIDRWRGSRADIARARYRNRQDCNLIGGSRVTGETKEWITSTSYPLVFFFFFVSSASRLVFYRWQPT